MGGALVIILSVSDDCGKAFTYESLCYVAGEQNRERKITLIKKKTTKKKTSKTPRLHKGALKGARSTGAKNAYYKSQKVGLLTNKGHLNVDTAHLTNPFYRVILM